jgi:hypothetical protein
MRPVIPIRFLLPIGLLLLPASFIIKRLFNIPDFADGLLYGIGFGIIILSLIRKSKSKQTA